MQFSVPTNCDPLLMQGLRPYPVGEVYGKLPADVVVVWLLIARSFEMFRSIMGTWLPFALMFLAVYGVGVGKR